MWTSRAYDHSTEESVGVEWEGGETRTRFEKNLEKIYGQWGEKRRRGDIPKEGGHHCADENCQYVRK